MKISECMTHDAFLCAPDDTIQQAAELMSKADVGFLPVGENDRLIGMITDRDIAIRGLAKGLKANAKVRDVMSGEVKYCFDDEDVGHVAHNMADVQVRRLPVVNRDKRLVGIVSLGDIAVAEGPETAGPAICGISEPKSLHSPAQMAG